MSLFQKEFKLKIESDVRDVILFADIVHDNSCLAGKLARVDSNIWIYEDTSLTDCQDMESEVKDLVEASQTGCIIYTGIESPDHYLDI